MHERPARVFEFLPYSPEKVDKKPVSLVIMAAILILVSLAFLAGHRPVSAQISPKNAVSQPKRFALSQGTFATISTDRVESRAIPAPTLIITTPDHITPESPLPTPTGTRDVFHAFLPVVMRSDMAGQAELESSSHDAGFSCERSLTVHPASCDVLVDLYYSTNGDHWRVNQNWLASFDPCSWYGVKCNDAKQVVRLELPNNNLDGQLPDTIDDLPLAHLVLRHNKLTGPFPRMARSSELEVIDIRDNQLQGIFPGTLFHFPKIRTVWLQENEFTRIETEGYPCHAVATLDRVECEVLLEFFRNTGGENPDSFYWRSFANHWLLNRDPCSWRGVLCQEGHVTQLRFIGSSGSTLRGRLTPELGALTELKFLIITDSELSGPLPLEIGYLFNLETLVISNSRLRSSIPAEIGYLTELTELDLSGNDLFGRIPSTLGDLHNVASLDFSGNLLSGPIPTEIGSLRQLRILNLSGNRFFGELPDSITSLNRLRELYLHDNGADLCVPSALSRFMGQVYQYTLPPGNICGPLER